MSSVTVVTTDGPAGRHGATVSAFCSVSADPPSTLVCLNAGCRIAHCVAANGAVCVNVQPRSRQDIADRFAGRHDDRLSDRFDGIECVPGYHALPVIEDATAFDCDLHETVDFGSHRIFSGNCDPLTYLDGAYRGVVPQAAVTQRNGKSQLAGQHDDRH